MQFNGLGKASNYIENILSQVVECEKNQITNLANSITIFIVIGAIVLTICMITVIPFAYFIENRVNLLWNQMKYISNQDQNTFKQIYIERLEKVHKSFGVIENIEKKFVGTNKIHFFYALKYIQRVSVFFIIGGCFYLISNYTFFVKFEKLLINRPQMLLDVIITRTYISKLDYWTKEVISRHVRDVNDYYPDYSPISNDFSSELEIVIGKLKLANSQMKNNDFAELFGKNLLTLLLEEVNDNVANFKFGINSAIKIMVLDSYYIASSNVTDPSILEIYSNFYQTVENLGALNEEIFKEAISHSKSVINQNINNYTVFCVFYSILLLMMFLVFYYPFFTLEKNKIMWMEKLSNLISSKNTVSKN